ncbi:unnamed protein product [Sphagnum tenellum]
MARSLVQLKLGEFPECQGHRPWSWWEPALTLAGPLSSTVSSQENSLIVRVPTDWQLGLQNQDTAAAESVPRLLE